jgi:YVTN family beta-propeller protein
MMAPPKQPEASAGVRQLEHLRSAWNSFRPAIGKFMFRTESLLARPREVPTSRALWLLTGALLLSAPFCAQAGRAYVTNEDGESVSVLDTDRAEVVATVNVGKRPRGMKLSRDGKELFVAVSGLPKCPPSVPDEECAKLKRDLTADGIAVIDTTTLKLAVHLKRRLRNAHRRRHRQRRRRGNRAGGKGTGGRACDSGRALDRGDQ